MTAPIDIECPTCKSTAGNYCTSETVNPAFRQRVTFYHAERVDEAFRANTRRQHDPRALREALREALDRLEEHSAVPQDALTDELSFIIRTREVFGLSPTSSRVPGHSPIANADMICIVGCTCGWQMPPGITDSDDAFAIHVALRREVDKIT